MVVMGCRGVRAHGLSNEFEQVDGLRIELTMGEPNHELDPWGVREVLQKNAHGRVLGGGSQVILVAIQCHSSWRKAGPSSHDSTNLA